MTVARALTACKKYSLNLLFAKFHFESLVEVIDRAAAVFVNKLARGSAVVDSAVCSRSIG